MKHVFSNVDAIPILAVCALLVFMFTGCVNKGTDGVVRDESARQMIKNETTQRFVSDDRNDKFSIITDSRTGVEYLKVENGIGDKHTMGISVLVDKDGKPILSEETF